MSPGDALEWGNVQGGTIADVVVNDDGTFVWSSGVLSFDVRAFTPGEGWGAAGTQDTAGAPEAPGVVIELTARNGSTVPDQSGITVVVRESVAATGVLYQTDSASITSSTMTLSSPLIGSIGDTVCVTLLSADGKTGGLWPAAPVIDLSAT